MKRIGLTALVAVVLSISALATSIVAYRTSTSITIGVDSKLVQLGSTKDSLICKIFRQKGTYFAIAGMLDDSGANFHVDQIIRTDANSYRTFEQRVDAVEKDVGLQFEKEQLWLRAHDPAQFREFIKRSKYIEVVLVEIVSGVPSMVALKFNLDEQTGKVRRQRVSCPGTCGNAQEVIYRLGKNVPTERSIKNSVPPADFVKRQVEQSSKAFPDIVGGPISILEITPLGSRWIENPTQCPLISRSGKAKITPENRRFTTRPSKP
jgi:hypothetical protein